MQLCLICVACSQSAADSKIDVIQKERRTLFKDSKVAINLGFITTA